MNSVTIQYDKYSDNYYMICNGVVIMSFKRDNMVDTAIQMLKAADVPNV